MDKKGVRTFSFIGASIMNGLIEEWYIGLVGKPEVSFAKVDAFKHIQDVLCTPGG